MSGTSLNATCGGRGLEEQEIGARADAAQEQDQHGRRDDENFLGEKARKTFLGRTGALRLGILAVCLGFFVLGRHTHMSRLYAEPDRKQTWLRSG